MMSYRLTKIKWSSSKALTKNISIIKEIYLESIKIYLCRYDGEKFRHTQWRRQCLQDPHKNLADSRSKTFLLPISSQWNVRKHNERIFMSEKDFYSLLIRQWMKGRWFSFCHLTFSHWIRSDMKFNLHVLVEEN